MNDHELSANKRMPARTWRDSFIRLRPPAPISSFVDGARNGGRARRTRLLLLLAVAALILLALAAYLLLSNRPGTLAELRARGVWRVGMDPSFPPFENLDVAAGQVVGLDADLARALGDQLGIKTEIASLGFDELLDAVAAHRIDAAISALPVIPERTREVRFSAPYVQAGVVLAARVGSSLTGIADLAGPAGASRTIAVEWGSQGDAEARRLLAEGALAFELLPRESVTTALDAVAAGEVDAAIVDTISLALHPAAAQLAAIGAPLVSDPYVVVVAADAPDLLRAVDDGLAALESDGTLEQLRQRWLRPPD